jgi:tetratricopeptide (TPR) repeat protein
LVCPPEKATWRLSAEEHNDLGVFFERAGALEPATRHYLAATQLRPENSYFRMNLGNALLKQRRLREAADTFARAVELDSQNADAMNNLAYAYLEMGRNLDDAIGLCHKALALRPSRSAYYLDTLGAIYLKQGRSRDAISTFEAALTAMTERQESLRPDIEQRLAAARAMLSAQPLAEE